VDVIYSESFSTPRIGNAIMNRLLKAAGHQVIHACIQTVDETVAEEG
jgi:L-threonylcarbamoyladenylate synthase